MQDLRQLHKQALPIYPLRSPVYAFSPRTHEDCRDVQFSDLIEIYLISAALAGTDTLYSFFRSLKFSHVGGMHTSPSKTSANSADSYVLSNMRPRTPTAFSPSKHRLTWAVRPWTSTTGIHFPTDPRNTSCPFSSRLMGSRSIRRS